MERLIIDGVQIALINECSFEDIIAQLQPLIPDRILCVVNGSQLLIWKDMRNRPKNLTFEGYSGDLYSFRDPNDTCYVVFGLESATVLHPELNERVYVTASISHDNTTYSAFHTHDTKAELSERVMHL
jgi:hypothetical protein